MKDLSYIKIMEALEEAIPQTTDFDYRKIDKKEMWERITRLLEKTGLSDKIREDKKLYLERIIGSIIRSIQEYCNEAEKIESNTKKNHFDQNNYWIKENVNTIRQIIRTILEEAGIYPPTTIYERDGQNHVEKYDETMGTDEEIERYTSEENVSKYIKKLLTLTVEDKRKFEEEYQSHHTINVKDFEIDIDGIIKEIFEHFGFSTFGWKQGTKNNSLHDILYLLINQGIYNAVFALPGETCFSNEVFNSNIDWVVIDIMIAIRKWTRKALEQRQIAREAYEDDGREAEVREDETALHMSTTPIIPGTSAIDYEKIITKYEKMAELVKKNKEMIAKIEELRTAIAANDAEIERLNSEPASRNK